jgi:hypothetical protein
MYRYWSYFITAAFIVNAILQNLTFLLVLLPELLERLAVCYLITFLCAQGDLNSLIRVSGVVTRRTGVFPQVKSVVYDCVQCGASVGPFSGITASVAPG